MRNLVLAVLLLTTLLVAEAQDAPSIPLDRFYTDRRGYPLRKILSKIHFSASTGFGKTYFKHILEGDMGIYQSPTRGPMLFIGTPVPTKGQSQWIDTSTPAAINFNNATDFAVLGDTAKIGFKSKSFTIPLQLTAHFEFKQKYRIGIGCGKDFIFVKPFKPIAYESKIESPDSVISFVSTNKWFLTGGYSFYRLDKFLFTGNVQVGLNKFGKNIDRGLAKSSPFFNLGVTVERELSEYLQVFVRPSFEFKSYTLNLPDTQSQLKHKANAFTFQFGLTYSIPELPKCKIKECRIQMHHAHGDREYRSRAHPIWKKQNPAYGENHPKPIQFKWWNRKKINAY